MEPIPGYRLTEQLGSGGYGVVWEAEAPGGLNKAVKIIYGNYADERASRELKSLNRIKDVRHPFLLSLERIEVIDGQLIIVTEMAECSLKDRFDACRAEGLPGLSREELLVYISDTADALDHMNEHHGLQHLDIKPENLLLLGGRVKVADFGLVKEVRDVAASLMGGLTPVYAPPEVFDGRPSRFSDQYSLAIVFLEMLTGHLPFSGTTAAQLATQHLSSRPNLDGLSPADADVIRRALAKNPTERFATCRDMVALLRQADQSKPVAVDRQASTNGENPPAAQRASRPYRAATDHATQTVTPQFRPDATVTKLGAVEITKADAALHPILLIGVGGVGGTILRNLRRRICDSFGSMANVPSIELLSIDTDPKSLRSHSDLTPLSPDEVLATPLRRPQEYRENASQLESVSRRWIYNIPRSCRTEGLRPLGRLALLDHSANVRAKIQERLGRITTEQSVRTTAMKIGATGGSLKPRIVLVGAASGGTGGGMMIDLAYLIRSLYEPNEQSKFELSAIMLHATPRNAAGKDLAVVNAYAMLSEISHFSRIDRQYPGERAMGVGPSSDPPFDYLWFNHLGEELSDQAFRAASQETSDHLFTHFCTSASGFFAACRRTDRLSSSETITKRQVRARSFGICRLAGRSGELLAQASDQLCGSLIRRWLGIEETQESDNATEMNIRATMESSTSNEPTSLQSEKQSVETTATGVLESLKLDYRCMYETAHRLVLQELSSEPRQFLSDLMEDLRSRPQNPSAEQAALVTLEAVVGSFDEGRLTSPLSSTPLGRKLKHHIDQHVHDQVQALCHCVMELTDSSALRLAAATCAGDIFQKKFKAIYEEYRNHARQLEKTIDQLSSAFSPLPIPPNQKKNEADIIRQRDENMTASLVAQLQLLAASAVRDHLRQIGEQVESAVTRVKNLDRTLQGFLNSFRSESDLQSLNSTQQQVLVTLKANFDRLVGEADKEVCEEILTPSKGLKSLVDSSVAVNDDLMKRLKNVARRKVVEALRTIDIATQVVGGSNGSVEESVQDAIQQATPRLVDCGGTQRLLLSARDSAGSQQMRSALESSFSESPTFVKVKDGDAVVCCEMQNIPLPQIAARLIDGRDDYAQVADRLWGRNDVEWTPWK